MARGENTANHPNRKVGRKQPMTAYEKHEKENPELMADMDGGLDAHFPESAKLNPKGAY